MSEKKKGEFEQYIVEGYPTYENEGNGDFSEWAHLQEGNNVYDLLDLFRKTELSDVSEIHDWTKCRVRVTIQVLSLKENEDEEK